MLGIFGNAKYLIAAALSGLLFFLLLALTSGMLIWGFWELNPFIDPLRVGIGIAISALFGANIAVLLHNADMRREAAGAGQMTILGAFAAMMTSSCPLCQPFILLAFGLGGIGALFAGLSLAISIFSAILLLASLKSGLDASAGVCRREKTEVSR